MLRRFVLRSFANVSAAARPAVVALSTALLVGASAATLGTAAPVENPAEPGPPDARCSLFPFHGPKLDGTLYFTGTASPDSVEVAPPAAWVEILDAAVPPKARREGEVVDTTVPGKARREGEAAVPGRSLREVDSPSLGTPRYHGQIVDADRIEALDASIEGHERVVVVPWGYDAACRVLPWSRDALFVPPGHRGFFHGDLRDRSEWVGGMPTIDTRLTWVQGYPRPDVERPLRMGFDPGTPDSQLRDPDADELLDFYLASPWASELGERGPGAVLELVDWVEARPQLNPGGLLSALIVGVASASATADARAHRPAWTGTWLMEWELSSGRSVRYWLRTEDAPIRTDRIRAYRRATGEPAQPLSLRDRVRSSLEVNGIAVGAWVTEDSLQARRPSAFNPWSPDAPGDVFTWWRRSPYGIPAERGDRAEAGPGGPLRAPIQVWELNHLFEDDPEFLQLRHDWWDYFEAESDAGRAIPVSGRLERGSDGGWTLTAEWDYGGGWVRLTGTRVSDLTFPTRR